MNSMAYVGWNGSEMDLSIMMETNRLLKIESGQIKNIKFFNLDINRDFLKDKEEFDIVILFYVFRYIEKELKNDIYYDPVDDSTRTSVLHNKENWRKRFLDSKAKRILLFGMFDSEINGDYIGELENYSMILHEQKMKNGEIYGRIWDYERS